MKKPDAETGHAQGGARMQDQRQGRVYARRCNSNGEDFAPTITCTIAKGVQRQLDYGGGYVLDYFTAPLDRADGEGFNGL